MREKRVQKKQEVQVLEAKALKQYQKVLKELDNWFLNLEIN